jgi:hypothetical protein
MIDAIVENTPAKTRQRLDRARVLRWMRDWHGYLSALAFIALMLFSATGVFLNHPEWFERASARRETVSLILPSEALRALRASADPVAEAKESLKSRVPVRGAFASGEVVDNEVLLRFESPRGATDAAIDLVSGRAEVTIQHAHPITLINELHRGKSAGVAWRMVIDVVACLTLATSLLGFALFLIMRTRITIALSLTVLGFLALALAHFIFIP